jgi:hypothetical protein
MTTRTPTPPPLDQELEALLRRMRLPHIRRTAPEVLATAKAQRWDPAEVLKVLLTEEVAGRDRSSLATRRARAAFPTGKTFQAWDEKLSSLPVATQSALRTLEWIDRRENLVVCGPAGTGKTFMLEALGQTAVEAGKHVAWCANTAPMTRCPRRSAASCAPISSSSTTSDSWPSAPTPPKGSTASSTPHTSAAASRSAATSTRQDSTSSCRKLSPPRPSTDCSTMPTSARQAANPSACPKPSTAKE